MIDPLREPPRRGAAMGVLVCLAAACGSKSTPRDEPGSSAPPAAPRDAATVAVADAPAIADAPGPAPVAADAPPAALPPIAVTVPTRARDLQRWLVAGHYKQWAHESRTHESDGPHGDAVKTFVSPSLASSLAAGGPHGKGAAAVKELYDKAGKHTGWAVSVKIADDSARGKGWYWYEVFSTAPGARPAYDGVGERLCRECHTEGGVDQVPISYPLL